MLELRLAERGYEVTVCRSAAEALQQFTQIGADALITEVDLQPEDGFSLVDSVRKQPGGAELPVLFLTRRGDRESMEKGLSLGAADYLLKPASAELVVATAGNLLQLNG